MARLIGPSEASREVRTIDSAGTFKSKATRPAVFYTDQAATTLADILTYPGGSAISGSTVTIDAYSMLPLIQFPDGVDTLYVVVDGGPAWPVYAREDDRLDALGAAVTANTTNIAGNTAAIGGKASTAYVDSATAAAAAFATQRANHTGTQSADTITDGTTNKAFLATERTKLAGIATGATANATDAQLRDRATHTGTQSADTLTDGTTNKAFLATERTKLAGVATGATANQADLGIQAKTANFTCSPQMFYPVDTTSGPVTATLPPANVPGQVVAIKRIAGTAPLTVQRAGLDTIGTAATSADITLDNEVWDLVSSGVGQWHMIAGNKTLSALDDRYGQNWLVTGQACFERELAISAVGTSNQSIRLAYFTARKPFSTTQVRMWTNTTPAGATPTLCRIGLWLAAPDGSASALVASTANDTTLFAAASTAYTRNWQTPYTMVVGQRYAIGALVVTAAATPTFLGATGPAAATEAKESPAVSGLSSGNADLPSTFTSAVAGTAAGRPYVVVL